MSTKFRYQLSVAVSGSLGGKVPVVDDVFSSHEQKISPTTSLDGKCKEFEFQTDWNHYVDLRQTYLALKLKFVKGRGYETHKTTEIKREHEKEAKGDEETVAAEEEQETPVPSATHVNNILHSISFRMLMCTSTISKSTTPMEVMRTNLSFPKTSKSHLWIQGSFVLRGVQLWRTFWWNYGTAFVWTFFLKEIKND